MDCDVILSIPVQVAVRVRPFDERERDQNAHPCMEYFVQQNQLLINDRLFAFDFVFDPLSSQQTIYDSCAAPLVDKLFGGMYTYIYFQDTIVQYLYIFRIQLYSICLWTNRQR
jgi:hypothetical protein